MKEYLQIINYLKFNIFIVPKNENVVNFSATILCLSTICKSLKVVKCCLGFYFYLNSFLVRALSFVF